MKLVPILFLFYMPVSFILLILKVLEIIPNSMITAWYVVLSILIIFEFVWIFNTERKKRLLGKRILLVNNFPRLARIGFLFFLMALLILVFVSTLHYINLIRRIEILSWYGAIIVYLLYTYVYSGIFLMENGIFYKGRVLQWNKFAGYSDIKNRSDSHKIIFSINMDPNLQMTIHDDQIIDFINIIEEKGCKKIE